MASAKMYIDENYQEAIDLDAISRSACLSRFHFHRLFKKTYHRTPHQYLTQKRLDRARHLLAENLSISDVCSRVGFESLASFSSLFKKEIGFAPTYYRNMAWLKKKKQAERPRDFIPHCFLMNIVN
jgi:AraC-like DNA-binding protein